MVIDFDRYKQRKSEEPGWGIKKQQDLFRTLVGHTKLDTWVPHPDPVEGLRETLRKVAISGKGEHMRPLIFDKKHVTVDGEDVSVTYFRGQIDLQPRSPKGVIQVVTYSMGGTKYRLMLGIADVDREYEAEVTGKPSMGIRQIEHKMVQGQWQETQNRTMYERPTPEVFLLDRFRNNKVLRDIEVDFFLLNPRPLRRGSQPVNKAA